MRLDLGSPVRCSAGEAAELADVVLDPTTRRVTHLVVQPPEGRDRARLVPIDLARATEGPEAGIALDCAVADVDRLEPLDEVADLRLGEFPVADSDWDVGVEDMLGLPSHRVRRWGRR